MLKIGDKVKIIKSPYPFSAKSGTIANVVDIVHAQYGKRWTIYILDTNRVYTFYEWELEKIEDDGGKMP